MRRAAAGPLALRRGIPHRTKSGHGSVTTSHRSTPTRHLPIDIAHDRVRRPRSLQRTSREVCRLLQGYINAWSALVPKLLTTPLLVPAISPELHCQRKTSSAISPDIMQRLIEYRIVGLISRAPHRRARRLKPVQRGGLYAMLREGLVQTAVRPNARASSAGAEDYLRTAILSLRYLVRSRSRGSALPAVDPRATSARSTGSAAAYRYTRTPEENAEDCEGKREGHGRTSLKITRSRRLSQRLPAARRT